MAAAEILIGLAQEGPQTLALKRANRHGLVAGATGTGKTVTLQVLAEALSAAGVAVFAADVKGDLSGIAVRGEPAPKWAADRAAALKIDDFAPSSPPVVFWDVYGKQGHPVRVTVTEMGPLLLSRILECTDAQEGAITVAFKLADDWLKAGKDQGLLLDLKDLRQVLVYIADNADEIGRSYGLVSPTTVAALQRKLLQFGLNGAEGLFGENALELDDLIRTAPDGRGVVNILAADKLVQSPTLYSTFMLWLMSELWESLPEVGDLDKPKIVFFFDEAHLLFDGASKELLDRVQQVTRLIRSKGVGLYFVTQSPSDVPDNVLAQLGNRIQHALRAYTPADQKALKAAAASYRAPPGFNVAEAIQNLGVGEALVSMLDENGAPRPVARTLVAPPRSRAGPVTPQERQAVMAASGLGAKYDQPVDRQSAFEILSGKTAQAAADLATQKAKDDAAKAASAAAAAQTKADAEKARVGAAQRRAAGKAAADRKREANQIERTAVQVGGRVLSNATNTFVREVMRGILGNLRR